LQAADNYEGFLSSRSLTKLKLTFVVYEFPPPEETLEKIQSYIAELFTLYYNNIELKKYRDDIPVWFMNHVSHHYMKLKKNDLWRVYKTVRNVFNYINEHKKLENF